MNNILRFLSKKYLSSTPLRTYIILSIFVNFSLFFPLEPGIAKLESITYTKPEKELIELSKKGKLSNLFVDHTNSAYGDAVE